jgi:hypothetical protein
MVGSSSSGDESESPSESSEQRREDEGSQSQLLRSRRPDRRWLYEPEKGNRPRASSMSEIPSDQTSDLTVYGAPWIRSG